MQTVVPQPPVIPPQPLPQAQTVQVMTLPAEEPNNKWLLTAMIGVFLVIMIAVFMASRAKRKRVSQNMLDVQENIESGRGGIGNTGIGNAVGDTKPDETYPYAFDDAQKICNAGGWISGWSQYTWTFLGGTNYEKIKAVFTGKTKAQVSAILEAFSRTTCNSTLDAFMQTYCDEGERKAIYQIIKSAK